MKLYAFLGPVSGSLFQITSNLVMIPILVTTALGGNLREPLDNVVLEQEINISAVTEPEILVAAYYYPWYADDFHGGKYLRGMLDPPQLPKLGEYNDQNSLVIAKHVGWSVQANIKVWFTSWFGPGTRTDDTTRNSILNSSVFKSNGMKFAIFYETGSRLGRNFDDLKSVTSDIKYMAEHFFNQPSYLRINGNPVVVVYLTRILGQRGNLNEVVLLMKIAAKEVGYDDLFIIGDHVFGQVPRDVDLEEFVFEMRRLDAITTHDVYGNLAAQGLHASKEEVESYSERASLWKALAENADIGFVPAVTPGFNNRALGSNLPALSRRLDQEDKYDGSFFNKMVKEAVNMVDPKVQNLIVVNSFNNWDEDTQIEPVQDGTSTDKDQSATREMFTQGLKYRAYGTKYLDILSEKTRSAVIPPPTPPKSKAMVAVYYYPWYGNNGFHGRKYLREKLLPPQVPVLGEYNDQDKNVIAQHIEWCLQSNIQVWVSSWWGPGSLTDSTTLNTILSFPKFKDSGIKLALFFETIGRMGNDFGSFSFIDSDIRYMAKHYFGNSSYLRIDGKPVVVIYLTRVLGNKGTLKKVTRLMREAARLAGAGEIYLIGDHVFRTPPSKNSAAYTELLGQMALLDAVTNYDVYGSSNAAGFHATQAEVDAYYKAQESWLTMARKIGKSFIPVVSPGYNDRAVRIEAGHKALSRKLESERNSDGSLFRAMLEQAVALVDDNARKMMMVTSFNEWHEDTQIEPVHIQSPTSKDNSTTGDLYCQNLEYEGYGTLYLDILKEETME